jgi:hypothetical protein
MDTGRLLRWWLASTGLVIVLALVWVFAPVLVFFVLVLLGFGGLAWLAVAFARSLERRRPKPPSSDD